LYDISTVLYKIPVPPTDPPAIDAVSPHSSKPRCKDEDLQSSGMPTEFISSPKSNPSIGHCLQNPSLSLYWPAWHVDFLTGNPESSPLPAGSLYRNTDALTCCTAKTPTAAMIHNLLMVVFGLIVRYRHTPKYFELILFRASTKAPSTQRAPCTRAPTWSPPWPPAPRTL